MSKMNVDFSMFFMIVQHGYPEKEKKNVNTSIIYIQGKVGDSLIQGMH